MQPTVALGSSRPLRPHARTSPIVDETNARILHLLAQRGRSSMREIADAVGRTESTVRERVDTLELRGIVMGYEARIDWSLAGLPLLVMIDAYCPPGSSQDIVAPLHRVPHLVQAFVTTGSPNVFASVRARDMGDVRKLVDLLATTGLRNVSVRIVLERLVGERPPLAAFKAAPSADVASYPSPKIPPLLRHGVAAGHQEAEDGLAHAGA